MYLGLEILIILIIPIILLAITFTYNKTTKLKLQKVFLPTAKTFPLLKHLIQEIESQGIKITSFGFFAEFFSQRSAILAARHSTKTIFVSNRVMNEFLKKLVKDKGDIARLALLISHEYAHILKWKDGKKHILCWLTPQCLHNEILANKIGIEIIKRITIENNLSNVLDYRTVLERLMNSCLQCHKCIGSLMDLGKKYHCYKDLKRMGLEINDGDIMFGSEWQKN